MFSPVPQRICPRCGHANQNKASYCFQCGRDLYERTTISGTPGTVSLIAGAFRFIEGRGYTLEPELSARLRDADRGFIYSRFEAAQLTTNSPPCQTIEPDDSSPGQALAFNI